MPRTLPTTLWNRDRFNFGITDVNGNSIVDTENNYIMAITDTNTLSTLWS